MSTLITFCLLKIIEVAPDTYDDLTNAKKTCDSIPASAVDILNKRVKESMSGSSIDAGISSCDTYWLPQVQ